MWLKPTKVYSVALIHNLVLRASAGRVDAPFHHRHRAFPNARAAPRFSSSNKRASHASSASSSSSGNNNATKRAVGGPGNQDVYIVSLADGYDMKNHLRWLSTVLVDNGGASIPGYPAYAPKDYGGPISPGSPGYPGYGPPWIGFPDKPPADYVYTDPPYDGYPAPPPPGYNYPLYYGYPGAPPPDYPFGPYPGFPEPPPPGFPGAGYSAPWPDYPDLPPVDYVYPDPPYPGYPEAPPADYPYPLYPGYPGAPPEDYTFAPYPGYPAPPPPGYPKPSYPLPWVGYPEPPSDSTSIVPGIPDYPDPGVPSAPTSDAPSPYPAPYPGYPGAPPPDYPYPLWPGYPDAPPADYPYDTYPGFPDPPPAGYPLSPFLLPPPDGSPPPYGPPPDAPPDDGSTPPPPALAPPYPSYPGFPSYPGWAGFDAAPGADGAPITYLPPDGYGGPNLTPVPLPPPVGLLGETICPPVPMLGAPSPSPPEDGDADYRGDDGDPPKAPYALPPPPPDSSTPPSPPGGGEPPDGGDPPDGTPPPPPPVEYGPPPAPGAPDYLGPGSTWYEFGDAYDGEGLGGEYGLGVGGPEYGGPGPDGGAGGPDSGGGGAGAPGSPDAGAPGGGGGAGAPDWYVDGGAAGVPGAPMDGADVDDPFAPSTPYAGPPNADGAKPPKGTGDGAGSSVSAVYASAGVYVATLVGSVKSAVESKYGVEAVSADEDFWIAAPSLWRRGPPPPPASKPGKTPDPKGMNATIHQDKAPWHLPMGSSRKVVKGAGIYHYNATAGRGVDIYIVDTGINVEHHDFQGRAKWGFVLPKYVKKDGSGHGTHVAGLAAGKTYGVAKGANLIAVKVMGDGGSGSAADIIAGLGWSIEQAKAVRKRTKKRSVINLSLSGPPNPGMDKVVLSALRAGIPVVVAAGNTGDAAHAYSPGRVKAALTVGALDHTYRHWHLSNGGRGIDLYAPGVNVISTWITNAGASTSMSGSSMSAPQVAGIVAYHLSLYPLLSVKRINHRLKRKSTKKVVKGRPPGTLAGVIFNCWNVTCYPHKHKPPPKNVTTTTAVPTSTEPPVTSTEIPVTTTEPPPEPEPTPEPAPAPEPEPAPDPPPPEEPAAAATAAAPVATAASAGAVVGAGVSAAGPRATGRGGVTA